MIESALYTGRVTHSRHEPRRHVFSYRTNMLALNLDQLPSLRLGPALGVEQPALMTFHRSDYRGDSSRPLKQTILDEVSEKLGTRPTGEVLLLTQVRSFGFVFNPVSFYYCFGEDGSLSAVLAEITNTPWKERHAYVLPASEGIAEGSFDKRFHVSPFFPMEQRYHWRFSAPGQHLTVEMRSEERGREVFRARLELNRRSLTRSHLIRAAIAQPLLSLKVPLAIYWESLRLWFKRTPFFEHPKSKTALSHDGGVR